MNNFGEKLGVRFYIPNSDFLSICMDGLDVWMEKHKVEIVNYDFLHRDVGKKERWENWLTGIREWWFFSDFIENPKEIAEKGSIELDLTKMTGFEFYTVVSAIRMMKENLCLHDFVFDLTKPTGLQLLERITYLYNNRSGCSWTFGDHSLFTYKKNPDFSYFIIRPDSDGKSLVDSNYNFTYPRIPYKSFFTEKNTK